MIKIFWINLKVFCLPTFLISFKGISTNVFLEFSLCGLNASLLLVSTSFPTAEKDVAEEVYVQGIAIEHTLVQVRTIARTLFDSAVSGGIADSTKKQIAVALSAASYAISSKIDDEEAFETTTTATDDAREAGAALAESLIEDAKDADQEQIIRGLSMVANIERIADSLDQNSPALKDVITPDEPAHAKVMAVSPIDQTLKINKRITKRFKKIFRKYF